MNTLQKSVLCVFGVVLMLSGCVKEETAPPVMSVMNDLDALEKEKAKEAQEAAIKSAAANAARNSDSHGPATATGVPREGEFVVDFETTVGAFTVTVNRAWAPIGAHRFYQLVKDGFYDGSGFFRVVPDFMVQWGLAADPAMTSKWNENIQDDPVTQSNQRGYITFAKTGAPNSRTGQVFINFKDNSFLDSQGFAPFGKVTRGMDVVDKINPEYGETPSQGAIEAQGNAYLKSSFPRLTFIRTARLTVDDQVASPAAEPVDTAQDGEAESVNTAPSGDK